MKTLKFIIAYNGKNYHGWQVQPNQRTVQGEIQKELSLILQEKVFVHGTSRTDAGVHAKGQVAHIKTLSDKPLSVIKHALNRRLDHDIDIIDIELMDENFHSRHSSKGKHYRYTLWVLNEKPLFCEDWVYWFPRKKMNIEKMRQEAKHLIGVHDFSSFASNAGRDDDPMREIFDIQVSYNEPMLTFDVKGKSFLYKMVRGITGTLIDIGLGKKEGMDQILNQKNRIHAGRNLPAKGLCLQEVYF